MTIHKKMKYVKLSEILVRRFAFNLRQTREARGLTHETLAAKAKITRPYVSMLEDGKRAPSLAMLCQIAEALAVDPAVLLKEVKS